MRPEWVIETIRTALVVRIDFVHPEAGGREFVHVEIFGGFEDDDGWDVSHLKLTVIEEYEVERFEFDSLFLPKIEAGHAFVQRYSARWQPVWLEEKRHIAGKAVIANGEQLVSWEKVPTHEPRVIVLLQQVLAHLQLRSRKSRGNEGFALDGTIRRLEAMIIEKQRHRDSFGSTD